MNESRWTSEYDAVISVDLGWSPRRTSRTAIAIWRPGQDPVWTKPGSSPDLLKLIGSFRGDRVLVLLDIPIRGTEGLSKDDPFRPLDRALIGCGIPLYPSYRAGSLGRDLANAIEGISGGFMVVESYPFPAHRFMWAAREEPWCLEEEVRPVRGLERWRDIWPPKYKRGPLPERRGNLRELVGVLGKFLPGDYSQLLPGPESGSKDLDALGDLYDALVALRCGMEMARSSPWILEARVEGHEGMIPLLADTHLRDTWEEAVARFTLRAGSP